MATLKTVTDRCMGPINDLRPNVRLVTLRDYRAWCEDEGRWFPLTLFDDPDSLVFVDDGVLIYQCAMRPDGTTYFDDAIAAKKASQEFVEVRDEEHDDSKFYLNIPWPTWHGRNVRRRTPDYRDVLAFQMRVNGYRAASEYFGDPVEREVKDLTKKRNKEASREQTHEACAQCFDGFGFFKENRV